jgi:hypothetical protein
MSSPQDICEPGKETELENQDKLIVGGRSVVVLVAK